MYLCLCEAPVGREHLIHDLIPWPFKNLKVAKVAHARAHLDDWKLCCLEPSDSALAHGGSAALVWLPLLHSGIVFLRVGFDLLLYSRG